MAIEKGLYAAPRGIDEEMQGLEGLDPSALSGLPPPDVEIDILTGEETKPEITILEDGSVEITLNPSAESDEEVEFSANLAEHMDEGELQSLAQ